ncbi:YicC family protein [Roseovarius faecimaris]|uniref:YicC family protein n=1 Tax=Roseovarius faecimaris TaxID=2494550 RepID=A0A6I6J0S8_9RHOB|nr:YicC/YloC family endoribonuclease [Roseovarius faecimaris]QGX98398.1 YicC family protein [Roseovarius faecimaris]
MTGFASAQGAGHGFAWSWELRSVNGKGLDMRLRLPEWVEGLEAAIRTRLGKALSRGNVSLALRMQAEDSSAGLGLNQGQLAQVLSAMADVETQAMDLGLTLAPANAADILALRGVMEQTSTLPDTAALREQLLSEFETLLAAFLEMRRGEGQALSNLLDAQLGQIAELTEQAAEVAQARAPEVAAALRANLAKVMEGAEGADEARVAQELALLAVKADVTEELDRLRTHVTAARDLLAAGSPIGRKLDFLSQEFNREANTLCSKAQNTSLTTLGIELKSVIDQMREQVQNVE